MLELQIVKCVPFLVLMHQLSKLGHKCRLLFLWVVCERREVASFPGSPSSRTNYTRVTFDLAERRRDPRGGVTASRETVVFAESNIVDNVLQSKA